MYPCMVGVFSTGWGKFRIIGARGVSLVCIYKKVVFGVGGYVGRSGCFGLFQQ